MGCGNGRTLDSQRPLKNEYPQCIFTYSLTKEVESLVSLDETHLLLGAKDELQLFDYNTKTISTVSSKDYSTRINYLIKLSDGKVASAGQDKTIRIWDISQNKLLYSLTGHTSMIWTIVEIKGNKIISGSDDKTVKIWDLKNKKEECELYKGNRTISALIQLKNGNILFSCGKDLRIFEIKKKKEVGFYMLKSAAWCMKELENGDVIAGLGNGSLVILGIEPEFSVKKEFQKGHKKPINNIIELDNHKIVTSSDENDMILWDVNDLESRYDIKGHTKNVASLAYISGTKFASVSRDLELKIWE